jgi:mono/diheme cytochrome c family protein
VPSVARCDGLLRGDPDLPMQPPAFACIHGLFWRGLACLAAMAAPAGAHGAEKDIGLRVYQQQCAACHGANGEGVKGEYDKPLIGDRSIGQLAELIAETMPADDPDACVGEDAAAVAAYIHEAFYSLTARARNQPARIELSRLTVRQYHNAVADLVGSFRPPAELSNRRGLQAEYFNSRRLRRDALVLQRRDPAIAFDFGSASPIPDRIGQEEFAIRWRRSIFAPDTGDYEFILETQNGARLWVNDVDRPLIDAWVRSRDDTEQRATIRLLGGRVYPLRLEMFKFRDPSVAVALKWKPPHQAVEVVPQRHLSPDRAPPLMVVATPFPPDDRSIGYERGTSVSKAWSQATTHAAIEVAAYVADHLDELASCPADAPDRRERLRDFAQRFVERAFRRPLSDEQRAFFVDRHFDPAGDAETSVRRVVLLALTSPRFLYHQIGDSRPDGYDVASRISFGLWDSLPDQELLDAAARGQLATTEQIVRQAQRMLPDLRAKAKLRELFHHWLLIDHLHEVTKDPQRFPDFDEALLADLRTSLDLFLDEVVWSEASDFRELLLAEHVYMNGRMANFHGVDLPADAPFQRVVPQDGRRAGVLSHPYLMAGCADPAASSPIHRGVFIARGVLGRLLRPPPEAVAPLAPDLHPDLTTRQRVVLQTSAAACQTCHAVINPLGFPLENFDAVGRYRREENGRPIDASGSYLTADGEVVEFADSPEAHAAFVEQVFHQMVKQPIRAYGADRIDQLRAEFVRNGFNIQRLVVDVIAVSALHRETSGP